MFSKNPRSCRSVTLLGVAGLVLTIGIGGYLFRVLRLAVAYKAKILCSGMFVAHRDAEDVIESDLAFDHHIWLTGIPVRYDQARAEVSAGWRAPLLGVALFRPGLGCTLTYPAVGNRGGLEHRPQTEALGEQPSPPPDDPPIAAMPNGLTKDLGPVMAGAFAERSNETPQRTPALVVVHRDRIVAERYAPGFGPETPLAGWSMAKTALNALTGVLVPQGKLALADAAPVPEWEGIADPRRGITIEQILGRKRQSKRGRG